jgi:hypothetical protein
MNDANATFLVDEGGSDSDEDSVKEAESPSTDGTIECPVCSSSISVMAARCLGCSYQLPHALVVARCRKTQTPPRATTHTATKEMSNLFTGAAIAFGLLVGFIVVVVILDGQSSRTSSVHRPHVDRSTHLTFNRRESTY